LAENTSCARRICGGSWLSYVLAKINDYTYGVIENGMSVGYVVAHAQGGWKVEDTWLGNRSTYTKPCASPELAVDAYAKDRFYGGSFAVGSCRSGHLSPSNSGVCKVCGLQLYKIEIVTDLLRRPVCISGYHPSCKNLASIRYRSGETEFVQEGDLVVIPPLDDTLVLHLMFQYLVINGK